jgi:lycopene cyclase domain-containing protein
MRHLAYVGVLAGCLAAALWLEPIFNLNVLRRWRRLLLTLLPVVIVFSLWDLAAIAAGQWSFDPTQMTGVVLPGGLPLDEVLFFVTVPICAILSFEASRAVLRRPAGDEYRPAGDGCRLPGDEYRPAGDGCRLPGDEYRPAGDGCRLPGDG